MGRRVLLIGMLLATAHLWAQQRVGDFIESTSYNDDKRGTERTMQYVPEGDAWVCVNGTNRYTRALYGGHSGYRLETSDRPVFALFQDAAHCRNVSFFLELNGQQFALDSTSWCRAEYRNGQRTYQVSDDRWQGGVLAIRAVCLTDSDAAVWQIGASGFAADDVLALKIVLADIRYGGSQGADGSKKRLQRNGDMGADPPGCFERDGETLQTLVLPAAEGYAMADGLQLRVVPEAEAQQLLSPTFARLEALSHQVIFHTPDPYINPLGSALVMAADGAWDGETWLHGAIGWRTQLAGWRAGYLADVLGWPLRARSHFNAYAESQVTQVPPTIPHPSQDAKMGMARAEKRWGTQMYSNGYICRKPGRSDQMNHYDMNLNYVDELLWHFEYDADTAYMRRMWPLLARHLAWEKRNFDPDDDGLYDAYCCIWASDALYYSGGAVTHSSAYNYRANLLAAKIARQIGENAAPYDAEAQKILQAMNRTLWMNGRGHWAEYEDKMGLQRLHEEAAVWSIYTPIDCGACSPEQAWRAVDYVTRQIPHIAVQIPHAESSAMQPLTTISTSRWMPYSWSINNVASAEVMHTALAYFKAGEQEEGFRLMKANILDQMYLGSSPANFGQVSFYDAARGECYRDFSDNTGISARTLIQGLFGIEPHALDTLCLIRPGFPEAWDSAAIQTPYLSYEFVRQNGQEVYRIRQHFARPLRIVVRKNLGQGCFIDVTGTDEEEQTIVINSTARRSESHVFAAKNKEGSLPESIDERTEAMLRRSLEVPRAARFTPLNIDQYFNAGVSDIFRNRYVSPRPAVTTLQIPVQGVGEWCHPLYCPEISDSVFRSLLHGGQFVVEGIPFRSPSRGANIVYTSLWDNYPDSITLPLRGRARAVCLLMAGSTNHMQSHIENGWVTVAYSDGTQDTLRLIPPFNWCPIEQDYYVDGKAFQTLEPRPVRICLGTGTVSRRLGEALNIRGVYGREIPGGAAQLLTMPLNPRKKLRSITLRTLSNDVIIGLMGITLAR